EVVRGARALLARQASIDIEHHGAVFLARRLDRRSVGRLAAAIEIGDEVGQPFRGLPRAQDGEQLGLQALVVAIAQLIEQRRALRVLRYTLNLRSGQSPQPVLQSL